MLHDNLIMFHDSAKEAQGMSDPIAVGNQMMQHIDGIRKLTKKDVRHFRRTSERRAELIICLVAFDTASVGNRTSDSVSGGRPRGLGSNGRS